jgi:thermitase
MCGTRRYLWTKLAAVVLIVLSVPAASKIMYVSGELVIKMEPGYSIELVNSQFGTWVDQHLPQLDIYLAQTGSRGDLDSLASAIEAMPEVQFCHPNYAVDPLQPVQSSLPVSDEKCEGSYTRQEAYERLGLGSAHGVCTGEGVHLAVLDGGVNFYHPALQTSVISGYDYIGNDTDAFDEPGGTASGHGTFVAGVTHLVAPNATVEAYRVSDTSGLGDGYVVAEAILQAVEDGCRVINLSLVMTAPHQAIAQAAAHAAGQGVLLVAAAGNGYADSAHYPASDPSVLSVAAVDTLDLLADFSSFGGHVDVCAPGTHIYSPYLDTGYAWWGGTSFAAPFVAAQAALLWDFKPEATLAEVTDAILSTAVSIDYLNPDLAGKLGAGLINPSGSIIAIRGGANALRVPSEYPTIQAAINASLDGDTVLVASGTYTGNGNRDIDFGGKLIVVMSEQGPDSTIIDCQGTSSEPHRAFRFSQGEDHSAVVDGFTITGGYAPGEYDTLWHASLLAGGGIYCVESSPTISNCIFSFNLAVYGSGRGGAVCCVRASPVLSACRFEKNSAKYGGGLAAYYSAIELQDCVFDSNFAWATLVFDAGFPGEGGATRLEGGSASFLGCIFTSNQAQWIKYYDISGILRFVQGHGGAVYSQACSAAVTNCTFYNNSADSSSVDDTYHDGGAGIFFTESPAPAIENSVFAFNRDGAGISSNTMTVSVACCDIFGNAGGDWVGPVAGQNGVNGNFRADPQFCDTAAGNLHVGAASPCAPWNNSCGLLVGALEAGCTCCVGLRGNVDGIEGPGGSADVADLTYLVAYLFQGGPPPPCPEEANVNGIFGPGGPIDVDDLTFLVAFLFQGGPEPPECS